MTTMERARRYAGPALFSFGFRPFFLGGAVIAATVPAITALSIGGWPSIADAYGLFAYHAHEMVFGFLGAVVAGFILTAIANWTGRLPLVGPPLMTIAGLWLAGRIAVFGVDLWGAAVAAFVDMLFLTTLAGAVWREVMAGKNWRNLPVCGLLSAFVVANGLWHTGMIFGATGDVGLRLGIGVIALLLSLIGGRITPSFTLNWLKKTGRKPIEAKVGFFDRAALVGVATAVISWVFAPAAPITGGLLLVSAALLLMRLVRWQGWRTVAEPLVVVLHAGYLWVSVGLALIGWSVLSPEAMSATTALHGLTAGAAGVMTLAVMTRATLGHTGRALHADAPTIAIYAFVNLGAAIRLAAPSLPFDYAASIGLASTLWSGAFALFAAIYGRYLLAPRLENEP